MDDLERAARITLVTNAISCLAQAADFGTLEEYGALLAEDLVWEFPGGTGPGSRRRSGVAGRTHLPAPVNVGNPVCRGRVRERCT